MKPLQILVRSPISLSRAFPTVARLEVVVRHCCIVWLAIVLTSSAVAQSTSSANKKGDQPTAAERIERATNNMQRKQLYDLKYKLQKDETVRWTVEHVASTKTQMAGELEETSSRSVSTKVWKISSVDSLGNMTFVHSIDAVDMWQKIGEDKPVSYNSKSGEKPPAEYQSVSEKLGKPLAVISITPDGQIKDKKTDLKGSSFGVGDVTVPLPAEPIPVGQKWNVPNTLSATDEESRPHQLKARIAYELIKVKDGNAYISFRTEVLTPVESAKIKSQIMQQKTKGYLVFDIKNGRPIRKEVEWDEKVQGYEGPDSFLEYLGRMSEKIVTGSSAETVKSVPLAPLKHAVADESTNIKNEEDSIRKK